LIWGSDAVVESWIYFRREAENYSSESTSEKETSLATMLHAIGRLILTVRKDIGYSGTNISELDIASLILKADEADAQQLLNELKKR